MKKIDDWWNDPVSTEKTATKEEVKKTIEMTRKILGDFAWSDTAWGIESKDIPENESKE